MDAVIRLKSASKEVGGVISPDQERAFSIQWPIPQVAPLNLPFNERTNTLGGNSSAAGSDHGLMSLAVCMWKKAVLIHTNYTLRLTCQAPGDMNILTASKG